MALFLSKNISNAVYSPNILRNNLMYLDHSLKLLRIYRVFITKNYSTDNKQKYTPKKYYRTISSASLTNNKFKDRKLIPRHSATHIEDRGSDLIHFNESDSFGLLSQNNAIFTEKYEHDEGDKKEQDFLENLPLPSQKLSTKQYSDLIKDHIKNKRIKEALDVLEVRMLKEDRVKPESYIYGLAIGACAEVGYTKKAFMLFNDMKRRALKVSGGVYTTLFNACANSPWKEDGLSRANHLRETMLLKAVEPNLTNYNSMIKCYGRCGDLKTAFQIVDEMCSKKIKIRVHTFNFLLQSCISDKESGFRYALIIWRKMLAVKEKPNIYSFNLMLRCIKECGFGDHSTSQEVFNELIADTSRLLTKKAEIRRMGSFNNIAIQSSSQDTDLEPQMDEKVVNNTNFNSVPSSVQELPNFLSRYPRMDGVLSIGKIDTPNDRFMIAGGVKGFFYEMSSYHVTPDIKTITQLLLVQPDTLEAEQHLIDFMRNNKMKVDLGFFNMLIKKRCFRFDYESARGVRKLIDEENRLRKKKRFWEFKPLLVPDIITYGVLSLCCDTKSYAEELLKEMNDKNLRVNSEIMGTMLRQATSKNDTEYVLFVLENVKKSNILVNDLFLTTLKKFIRKCQSILKFKSQDDHYLEGCKSFLDSSKMWVQKISASKQEEPEHPWNQFRTNQPETLVKPEVTLKRRIYKKPYRKIPKYVVTA